MRKVIEGRRYDTDTARFVGGWEPSEGAASSGWYRERLYCKRSGEYFLWGAGGETSPYSVVRQGKRRGGEAIVKLGYEEAREWAEGHLDAGDYADEFDPPADAGNVMLTVNVSASSKRRLDNLVARTGRNRSEIIDEFLSTL